MSVSHLVGQGDSLWALAGRYLGSHNLWPSIHDYHNQYVQQNGGIGRGLKTIDNPDLIFVGQIVMIPGRGENRSPVAKPANTSRRTKSAVPLDASVKYILDPDPVAPTDVTLDQPVKGVIKYGPFITPGFTMSSTLSGRITLKNLSPTRHQANWELALSEEKGALSYALRRQGHDAAFLELVSGMEMDFNPENRRATIRPTLAAKAGLGPYTLRLEMINANQLSWTLKLDAISGESESHGRRFRFSADVNIKVDVTLHPSLRPVEPEPLHKLKSDRVPAAQRTPGRFLPCKTELLIGGTIVAGVVLAVAASPLLIPVTATAAAGAGAVAIGKGTLNMLERQRRTYRHVIDPDDPRLRS